MKKILVPIDFSDVSSHALDFAIEFNEFLKAEIILLHVIELPMASMSTTGEISHHALDTFYTGEYIKGLHDRLDEWMERVTAANQSATSKMTHGNPYKSITETFVEQKVNWIIMGSKGASGLKEVFIGSNTERVIRHADCPVITVKGPTSIKDMKNMVFASDLSEDQDWVAHKAKEIQELLGLNMHIVKVRTPHNFLTVSEADKQLEKFAKRNHFENTTMNSIESDYPDEGVLEFAHDNNSGLIVMGTHGRTGLAHLFGGSRAEDLANQTNIPLVTFKIPFD